MIEAFEVSFFLSNVEILNNISLSWKKPGCYTLLGPNGAGKTSLLRRLAGIDSLGEGEGRVLWNNREMASLSLQERSKRAAFLSQNNSSRLELSIWELMGFARYPYMNLFRSLTREEKEWAKSLLSKLELIDLKDRKLNTLSAGELQKVHLSACLFQDPQFLFLDEPLSCLDIYFQEEICNFLKNWCRENQTQVIMVSHHLNWALLWSDEVLFLDKGKLLFKGEPREISKDLIDQVYRGSLIEIQRKGKKLFLPRDKW